jgi:hypothetical protein
MSQSYRARERLGLEPGASSPRGKARRTRGFHEIGALPLFASPAHPCGSQPAGSDHPRRAAVGASWIATCASWLWSATPSLPKIDCKCAFRVRRVIQSVSSMCQSRKPWPTKSTICRSRGVRQVMSAVGPICPEGGAKRPSTPIEQVPLLRQNRRFTPLRFLPYDAPPGADATRDGNAPEQRSKTGESGKATLRIRAPR